MSRNRGWPTRETGLGRIGFKGRREVFTYEIGIDPGDVVPTKSYPLRPAG